MRSKKIWKNCAKEDIKQKRGEDRYDPIYSTTNTPVLF